MSALEILVEEHNVLFPMADQILENRDMDLMLADFREIEAGAGRRHAQYIEIAKQLCKQYGVDFVEQSEIKIIMREFVF